LDDARAALGRRLSRRGFGPAALAAVLVADCAPRGTASAGAMSATITAVTLWATGGPSESAIPPPVVALTAGVMNAMSLNRVKAVVVVLLAVGVLGILGPAAQRLQARVEPTTTGAPADPPTDAKPPDSRPAKPATETAKLQGTWEVTEIRLDGETK